MDKIKMNSYDTKPREILGRWIKISLGIYIPSWIIIAISGKVFSSMSFYSVYYYNFINYLLDELVFILLILFLIVSELIYFYGNRKYKNAVILTIILIGVLSIIYRVMPYSDSYRFYKDFNYVINGTYCEEVQTLKDIYIYTSHGKITTKTEYLETSKLKFQIGNNILIKWNGFDQLREKFKNGDNVKIKYLPNSNELLSIELVE